jgi:flagellar basal body rod protein FlgB
MFENVFGIHEQALLLQGQRVGILATNLANADTPNYKARDIDFSAVLSGSDAAPLPLSVTEVPQSLSGLTQFDQRRDQQHRSSVESEFQRARYHRRTPECHHHAAIGCYSCANPIEQSITSLQGLDYAKAITSLDQQNTTFSAALQAFTLTQGLSLFKYL